MGFCLVKHLLYSFLILPITYSCIGAITLCSFNQRILVLILVSIVQFSRVELILNYFVNDIAFLSSSWGKKSTNPNTKMRPVPSQNR